MERYTVFDVETANRHPSSICAIGLCVVENNKVIKTFYSKVKPVPFLVEKGNYKIHHLSSRKLFYEPTFDEVWKQIHTYFENTIIVSHNIQQDSLLLQAVLDYYGLDYPNCLMSCSYILSKKLLPECPAYKLDAIAKYFSLKFEHHHALEDAMMCFRILKKIKTCYHVKELNDLHEMLHLDYGKMAPHYYRNIFGSDIERNQQWTLEGEKDPSHFLFHQCLFLDSLPPRFSTSTKEYIEKHGGFIQEKVNRNTHYLIHSNKRGSKNYKKALELIDEGQDIQFLSIYDFIKQTKLKGEK